MSADAGDVSIDSRGADIDVSGDLAVGHTPDGLHEDALVEVGTLLPVGCIESLGAERPFAAVAYKPLDTLWSNQSPEGANLFVGPVES